MSSGGRKKWDEQAFFEDVKNKLEAFELESIRKLYNFFVGKGCSIRWGTGKQNGSYSIIVPDFFQNTILSLIKGEEGF